MIFTVSSAAALLRSTQNTCAPSLAKVTAVALPLPQPGPIEPAPTTIAVLPLSRCIDFSLICLLSLARPHRRGIRAERMPEYLRQRMAIASAAQPPFAGGAGIGQHQFRQRRALWRPLKPKRLVFEIQSGPRASALGTGKTAAPRVIWWPRNRPVRGR